MLVAPLGVSVLIILLSVVNELLVSTLPVPLGGVVKVNPEPLLTK